MSSPGPGAVISGGEDEFALLADNAAEAGLEWSGPPEVHRVDLEVAPGRALSALRWGSGRPQMVLLHGGAQNAHTWDGVLLALEAPALAIDLPGHGRSSWREDGVYEVESAADDVDTALREWAPDVPMVVGMSLGGLVGLALAARHPEAVRRLALVDITPGTDQAKAEPILAFIAGPSRFSSFEEVVARACAYNPARPEASVRRGVVHNARRFPDGSWGWRWDPALATQTRTIERFPALWAAVAGLAAPLLLVRGERSTVVSDQDVAELLRLQPTAEVEVVAGAGHSVQGDQPRALAAALARFAGQQR